MQFGFSNLSPSPTSLEITQLEMLALEKESLYKRLRETGLSEEASVALISGAVVSVHPDNPLEEIGAAPIAPPVKPASPTESEE